MIVGWSTLASGHQAAFRWTDADGMVALDDLCGTCFSSVATAVSADGSVVVGSFDRGRSEAFVWTQAGGGIGLGDLQGRMFGSYATAVSADGSVVVGSVLVGGIGSPIYHAFIWDATNGMRRLDDVLAALGLDLTGWTLVAATGISADGLTIVGQGRESSSQRAWIAVIPEPSSGLLLASGLVALAAIRRRIH